MGSEIEKNFWTVWKIMNFVGDNFVGDNFVGDNFVGDNFPTLK